MLRHPLVACLVACAVAFCLAPESRAQQNVLILVADDVGVDNVGVYAEGANPPPTPNIDQLAQNGVLFRNAWANSKCSPTRACIQTGRYSFRTGVGSAIRRPGDGTVQNALPLSEVTFPEHIQANSATYAFAAIGKWHLGDDSSGGELAPNLAGWTHFAGLLPVAADYYNWPRTVNGTTRISTNYQTTQMVDDALAWLKNAPEPWVCYVAFGAAHAPFHAPPPSLHTQTLPAQTPHLEPLPFYKAMVEAMDTEIGRLLTSINTEVRSRTNVIFIGDNGTSPYVSEPPFIPWHAKGTPFEGGVNVPLIVAGPAVVSPGRESGALVGAVDLFATITELCGTRPSVPNVTTDSVTLLPILRDPEAVPARETVFAEQFESWSVSSTGFATIRNRKYKLIRYFFGEATLDGLIDLENDPFEAVNLLRAPVSPEQAANYTTLSMQLIGLRRN